MTLPVIYLDSRSLKGILVDLLFAHMCQIQPNPIFRGSLGDKISFNVKITVQMMCLPMFGARKRQHVSRPRETKDLSERRRCNSWMSWSKASTSADLSASAGFWRQWSIQEVSKWGSSISIIIRCRSSFNRWKTTPSREPLACISLMIYLNAWRSVRNVDAYIRPRGNWISKQSRLCRMIWSKSTWWSSRVSSTSWKWMTSTVEKEPDTLERPMRSLKRYRSSSKIDNSINLQSSSSWWNTKRYELIRSWKIWTSSHTNYSSLRERSTFSGVRILARLGWMKQQSSIYSKMKTRRCHQISTAKKYRKNSSAFQSLNTSRRLSISYLEHWALSRIIISRRLGISSVKLHSFAILESKFLIWRPFSYLKCWKWLN